MVRKFERQFLHSFGRFAEIRWNYRILRSVRFGAAWCNVLKALRFRSSHQRYSIKIGVLKNSQISQEKPVPESLFNKVAGLRHATLLKKRLWHRTPPVTASVGTKTAPHKKDASVFLYNSLIYPNNFFSE